MLNTTIPRLLPILVSALVAAVDPHAGRDFTGMFAVLASSSGLRQLI
jgi:hypothetical protein